jgi:hypothetical protein
MSVKIFSNNMDEPNLREAIKKDDLNDINSVINNLSKKIEKVKNLFQNDIDEEDEFATSTFEKFHMFYGFVLIQTIVIIFLGIYQVFVIRKKIILVNF